MLTVSGIVFIPEVPEEKVYKELVFFSFRGVTKDPYKEGSRKWYKLNVTVPKDRLDEARKGLAKGKTIQIRIGELDGFMSDQGGIIVTVKSRWQWIEVLAKTLQKKGQEREEENGTE